MASQRRLDALITMGGGGALDPHERARLTDLWLRGAALQAMGRRQGPVASVLASIAKLGTTELMFDTAMFRADHAGADAMLSGRRSRAC